LRDGAASDSRNGGPGRESPSEASRSLPEPRTALLAGAAAIAVGAWFALAGDGIVASILARIGGYPRMREQRARQAHEIGEPTELRR
jgi:hypothetical protein